MFFRKADSDFAKQKSQNFKKELSTIIPDDEEHKKQIDIEKKTPDSTKKTFNLNEDNFSSASFKTIQTSATLENNLLSKENIIFQKYMFEDKPLY